MSMFLPVAGSPIESSENAPPTITCFWK